MSDSPAPTYAVGSIIHHDLTVPDADGARDFYGSVLGWKSTALSMGDHDDYIMSAADGTPVAGVCHALGSNAELPPQWLMYVQVADLEETSTAIESAGGRLVTAIKGSDGHRYRVVEDPNGAVFAISGV